MENINELSIIDRPRERMIMNGPTLLTNIELVAILLGSGTRNLPILTLCNKIMQAFNGDLQELGAATMDELCAIKGIGRAKGAIILAAMELGRRRLILYKTVPKIRSEADAIRLVQNHFEGVKEQLFMLILLNKCYELLAISELPLNNGLPHINQLMQIVMESGADGFGIVRNQVKRLKTETKMLADIGSAATMLGVKFYGRVIIENKT